MTLIIVVGISGFAVIALGLAYLALHNQHKKYLRRFAGIVDIEKEYAITEKRLSQSIRKGEKQLTQLQQALQKDTQLHQRLLNQYREQVVEIQAGIDMLIEQRAELEESSELRSYGLYDTRFQDFQSEAIKERLQATNDKQKAMVKNKRAATCAIEWTVDGSKAKGRKHTTDYIRLVLRAFNGESDAAISKCRHSNYGVMMKRIEKSFEVLNKVSRSQKVSISNEYLNLKLEELELAFGYRLKKQQEKEEQKRIKEQMREELRAQKEAEKAQKEAEKEEERYLKALNKARKEVQDAVGAKHEKLLSDIAALEARVAEAEANRQRAISRAQMTRSGHVYIVSNVGSFGQHVYKVGMTRRLDPMDRVRELGDASVPFRFDVHAIIYSDDAPSMEAELHRAFDCRRVNLVNGRKEFFHVTIDEIASAVNALNAEIEIIKEPEAEEYRQSLSLRARRNHDTTPSITKKRLPAALEQLVHGNSAQPAFDSGTTGCSTQPPHSVNKTGVNQ